MDSTAKVAAAEIFPSMSEKRRHEATMGLDDHRKRAERIIQQTINTEVRDLWDVVKLLIGRDRDICWTDISDDQVDGYITEIRRIKKSIDGN